MKELVNEYVRCWKANDRMGRSRRNDCDGDLSNAVSTSKAGLSRVGHGAFRIGYGFKHGDEDCVVKVARDGDLTNREANLKEWKQYYSLPPKLKKWFLPVTDGNREGYWIVGPKVLPGDKLSTGQKQRFRGKTWGRGSGDLGAFIVERLLKEGFYCGDVRGHDVNAGIMTLKNGREQPVIIDAGFGLQRCAKGQAPEWHGRTVTLRSVPPEEPSVIPRGLRKYAKPQTIATAERPMRLRRMTEKRPATTGQMRLEQFLSRPPAIFENLSGRERYLIEAARLGHGHEEECTRCKRIRDIRRRFGLTTQTGIRAREGFR